MSTQKYAVIVATVLFGVAAMVAWTFMSAQASANTLIASNPALKLATRVEPLAPEAQRRASGGNFMISHLTDDQSEQKMAYNPVDDEYLVVWAAYRGALSYDILGQIYSAQGVPQGTQFVICSRQYDQRNPTVAYNTVRHEYLVVWDDYSVGGGYADPYGQRVTWEGALVADDFPIATSVASQDSAVLAYNPTADEYLVVWTDTRNGGSDIYGRRVDWDGFLLGDADLAIATGGNAQVEAKIAYNNLLDEYMVVWRETVSTNYDVHGQRIDADGTLIGTNLALLTSAVASDWAQALIYNPIRHRYLLVWLNDTSASYMDLIYAAWMQGDGTLDSSMLITDYAETGHPVSACADAASGQSWVVWGDMRNSPGVSYTNVDIYAARILGNGEPATQGNFAISTVDAAQTMPVVACSSASHQALVIFNDDRDTERIRLIGQRVWWPGLLLGNEFAVGVPDLAAFDPAVAFDERENRYLVVWSDDRNGEFDIFGQLFDRNGLPIEDNFVISQHVGDQMQPDVAYNAASASYLVVWEDSWEDSVYGQLVSTQGSLSYSPILIAEDALEPAVAASTDPNPTDFQVVFEQVPVGGGDKSIRARGVLPNGTLVTDLYAISDFPGNHEKPDVVYNPSNNSFLVVWQVYTSGVYQVYGLRYHPHSFPPDDCFQISTGLVNEQAPAVAYNPDGDQYLVAWQRDQSASGQGQDIFAQKLDHLGNLLGVNFKVSTVTGDSDQTSPAAIYFAALQRYGVIWVDDRDPVTLTDLRGQWLSNTGAVLGSYDLPIFRAVGEQSSPAIVYAPGYDQALTVWADNSLTGIYSIHGRFSPLDSTPPQARFTVDDTFGFAGQTYAFNAWPSRDNSTPRGLLMVRWDLNSDGVWDTDLGFDKYITRTVPAAGIYTITMEITDQAWLTDTVKHRIIVLPVPPKQAANPSQPSAPAPGLTVTPTLTVAGSTFTFDGQASTGTGTLWGRWDFENDGLFDTSFSTTLTTTHVYTQAGDYTVRLELRDDSLASRCALVNLTVLPAAFTSLEVSPSQLQVIPSEVVRLRLTASDVYGNEVFNPAGITWTMLAPEAGSVDASGVFTASLQAGTNLNAIQANLGGLTDTLQVTIYWPFQANLPLVLRLK